jgi:hypothetical protein
VVTVDGEVTVVGAEVVMARMSITITMHIVPRWVEEAMVDLAETTMEAGTMAGQTTTAMAPLMARVRPVQPIALPEVL